jgi:uncharacterized protein (DUF924 family)
VNSSRQADSPEDVLGFWFEPGQQHRWFESSEATDRQIAERFAELWKHAREGKLDHWADHARGRLALVILLDQFSRNLNRDSPAAFECDARAQRLALGAEASGHAAELRPIERAFLFMPLMHAEDSRLQQRGVEVFEELGRQAEDCKQFGKYARMHRDIVVRFGRFPHRNAVLGRTSTAEEREFLAQGGLFGGGAA